MISKFCWSGIAGAVLPALLALRRALSVRLKLGVDTPSLAMSSEWVPRMGNKMYVSFSGTLSFLVTLEPSLGR